MAVESAPMPAWWDPRRSRRTMREAHQLWAFIPHARIAPERAAEFWKRAMELVHEFDELPRSGDTVYGFAVGIYPTDQPILPPEDG